MSATTCSHCSAALPSGARFCAECGQPTERPPAEVRKFGAGPPPAALKTAGRRLSAVRIRGRALVAQLAAESHARRELIALRHELERLHGERERRLRALGDAVYRGDARGTEDERAGIEELDGQIAAKEEQMTHVALQTQERVAQVQAESRPTELLEAAAPVPVPEPYPPPDEGTPPTPTPVPEPYPPPDEGDPPEPA
jgi:hypothetical protein